MNFNAQNETKKIIKFIQKYYYDNNLSSVIIGISGGKDSAVVSALFTKALGKENVIGVTLPCYSKEEDKVDAKVISDFYGFKLINFDLTPIYDTFNKQLDTIGKFNSLNTKNSDINLKPRLRMATLYYLGALFSSIDNKSYLVAGTSNKCEIYVGYYTKGGDNVNDISILADFTVDEVIKIGNYLNVPKSVLYKKPSDGLSNQTDEEKLGVTYKEIETYLKDPSLIKLETAKKIKKLHYSNLHKLNVVTYKRKTG